MRPGALFLFRLQRAGVCDHVAARIDHSNALVAEADVSQRRRGGGAAVHHRHHQPCLPLHRIDLRLLQALFITAEKEHPGNGEKDD